MEEVGEELLLLNLMELYSLLRVVVEEQVEIIHHQMEGSMPLQEVQMVQVTKVKVWRVVWVE
jgi:hypothetical protein